MRDREGGRVLWEGGHVRKMVETKMDAWKYATAEKGEQNMR